MHCGNIQEANKTEFRKAKLRFDIKTNRKISENRYDKRREGIAK